MQLSDLYSHKFIATRETSNYRHFSQLIDTRDFEVNTEIVSQSEFVIGNHSRSTESLLNNEICKYACAALETYLEIKNDSLSVKSISWALIRTYYASFYAAHACLKSVGQFVTRLESKSCEIIQKEAIMYYPTSLKPFASEYHIIYDNSSNNLIFKQLDKSKGGGYHERFWFIFNDFIEVGLQSPLRSQTVYQDELLFLQLLKDNVNKNGSPTWLSSIRNQINYQMPLDIWYPYDKKQDTNYYQKLIKTSNTQKKVLSDYNDLNSNTEIAKFCCTCNGIIDLMIKLTDTYFAKTAIKGNLKKATFERLLNLYNQIKYIS
jgi:hypothetical protein